MVIRLRAGDDLMRHSERLMIVAIFAVTSNGLETERRSSLCHISQSESCVVSMALGGLFAAVPLRNYSHSFTISVCSLLYIRAVFSVDDLDSRSSTSPVRSASSKTLTGRCHTCDCEAGIGMQPV